MLKHRVCQHRPHPTTTDDLINVITQKLRSWFILAIVYPMISLMQFEFSPPPLSVTFSGHPKFPALAWRAQSVGLDQGQEKGCPPLPQRQRRGYGSSANFLLRDAKGVYYTNKSHEVKI